MSVNTARYHSAVLEAVPIQCRLALDIGCGSGIFSQQLALRAHRVYAIDRDLRPMADARSRVDATRITFICADFMEPALATSETFDFVCSLASLHHMPMVEALQKMRSLLRPGGVLAVIGLYRTQAPSDFLRSLVAFPVSLCLRVLKRESVATVVLRDPQLTFAEISAVAREHLPGAAVQRRLLWRYTLLYRDPRPR